MVSRTLVLLSLLALALPAGALAGARDRDRDGLPDRWEKTHRLKVGQRDAGKDPDRDGLTNRAEYRARTNPRRADTDRDGIKDGAERRCGTDPRRRTRRSACAAPARGGDRGATADDDTEGLDADEGAAGDDELLDLVGDGDDPVAEESSETDAGDEADDDPDGEA